MVIGLLRIAAGPACNAIRHKRIDMTTPTQLADENKLTVVYRIEPGCLGPTGKDHVEACCAFAQQAMQSIESGFISWQIVPRFDKTLPELQYQVVNKKLDTDKTEKYLQLFDRNLADFENNVHERISVLIEQYLDRPA